MSGPESVCRDVAVDAGKPCPGGVLPAASLAPSSRAVTWAPSSRPVPVVADKSELGLAGILPDAGAAS